MLKKLPPNKCTFIQSRADANFDVIDEYVQLMLDDVEFDPVSAVEDADGTIYVYDGYHRGQAAERAGIELAVETQPGDRSHAEWLALAANQKHGLRRTRADRRRVVRLALLHPDGAKLSDREIARHCGVHHSTVGAVRGELEATGEISQSSKRVGADGREIDTARIGSGQPDYVAIWELEGALKNWLKRNYSYPDGPQPVDILEGIKQKTSAGMGDLEVLLTRDILPGPRRKRDVIQACNNALEQLKREAERAAECAPKDFGNCAVCNTPLTGPGWTWAKDRSKSVCDRCSGEHSAVSASKNRPEFDCPTCDQEKIVRVNGGALCLHCGARWETAEAFHAGKPAERNEKLERQQMHIDLINRFRDLIRRDEMDTAKLAEVGGWLAELEQKYPIST